MQSIVLCIIVLTKHSTSGEDASVSGAESDFPAACTRSAREAPSLSSRDRAQPFSLSPCTLSSLLRQQTVAIVAKHCEKKHFRSTYWNILFDDVSLIQNAFCRSRANLKYIFIQKSQNKQYSSSNRKSDVVISRPYRSQNCSHSVFCQGRKVLLNKTTKKSFSLCFLLLLCRFQINNIFVKKRKSQRGRSIGH